MKYLIIIPFIFVAVVAMADRTHETRSTKPSSERELHPVAAPTEVEDLTRRSLAELVNRLDSGLYLRRQSADNELRRRLTQNCQEIAAYLRRSLLADLSAESRTRITNLLRDRVDWFFLFENIKANVLSSPESLSAKNAYDRISSVFNENPNIDDHLEVLRRAGYRIVLKENEIPILETLVIERNNQLFRVHFMGRGGLFSIERVSQTGANEYSQANARINLNEIIRSLSPLDRTRLCLSEQEGLFSFSISSGVYGGHLGSKFDLGGNFVTRLADSLMRIMPNLQSEIVTARDRFINEENR